MSIFSKPKYYCSELDIIDFKRLVKKQIVRTQSDNLWNHLKTCFSFDEFYAGTIEDSSFSIWYFNSWRTSFFYAVIKGVIIQSQDKYVIKLTANWNIFGKMFVSLLLIGTFIALIISNLNLITTALVISPFFLVFLIIVPNYHRKLDFLSCVDKLKLKLTCANMPA